MAKTSSFSKDSLLKILKNSLLLSTSDNISYSERKHSENKNILLLDLSLENEDSNRTYMLVRILNVTDLKRKEDECVKFLNGVFTIQDTTGKVYLGFEKKNLQYPSQNNVEHLKIILKALAKSQVHNLAENKEHFGSEKNDLTNVFKTVMSLDMFKLYDSSGIASKLQKSVDELVQSGLTVKSVGNIFAANVFLGESDECTFLKLGDESLKSPVYDALSFIFALADDNFRQLHMKKLLSFYYNTLFELLKEVNDSMALNFTENIFEKHVKIFLPIIKLEAASYLIKDPSLIQNQNCFNKLLKNIEYFLKYPQLNYEDCLEAVSNKLRSSDFELLDYKLVPIQEKFGYLGEYWYLKTDVRHSDQIMHFSMFTKVLNADNGAASTLVQSGLSLREQFFYRHLIHHVEKCGLSSLVDFIPKYYFDRLNDVIVMEDLVELGYKPLKSNIRFEYDDLKVIFSSCAKFHACSLLLEDHMSKSEGKPVRLNNIYGEYLSDIMFTVREGLPIGPLTPGPAKPGFEQLIDSFAYIFKNDTKQEFQEKVDELIETMTTRTGPAEKFRNVICHGDFYSSNMLGKYGHDDVLKHIAFVDFQVMRYAPPTQDLLFIVYHNTNKDVRDKHLDNLLKEYYQTLKKILLEFQVDINTIYTPEQFSECVTYMKPTAICMALIYSNVTNIPSGHSEYMSHYMENRKKFVEYMLSVSDSYTNVTKALITDLYNAIMT